MDFSNLEARQIRPNTVTISLNDQAKGFFLENGKISMLITKDSIRQAQITGTQLQEEYNYFQNQLSKPLNDKMADIG